VETAYLGFIDLPKFHGNEQAAGRRGAGGAQTRSAPPSWRLLVVHIGAAVFHQAIRRDGTLLRMV
jgi:cytochrome b561